MGEQRPDIPKRLAARIRAAQERVKQKRLSISSSEFNNKGSLERVREFEADPEAFAARYYRGHGVDSYPVQTTINRERERLDYHTRRKGERVRELAELETELLRVEEQVLMEVSQMRRTAGRVAWPHCLPSFDHHQAEFDNEMERLDLQWEEQRAKDEAESERLEAARMVKHRAEIQLEEDAARESFLKLSPQEQRRTREWGERFKQGIDAGEFTFTDFLESLQQQPSEDN